MTHTRSHLASEKRGSVHVAVMGVAMIVAVMAAGALTVRRIERRMTANTLDRTSARLYALAAIEVGQLRARRDPSWRYTLPNGSWKTNVTIGSGTYSLEGIDPVDGDLTDDPLELVEFRGTGQSGAARQRVAVTLQPTVAGMASLEATAIADTVTFDNTSLTCDNIVAANRWAYATWSSVNCDVEAVENIWGWSYHGTRTSGVQSRLMPDSNTVFNYYVDHGTSISISDLAIVHAGHRVLKHALLSPTANPFGSNQTNSRGIYVIDCGGRDLTVRNCRIVGTLVVLNAGPDSRVGERVNFTPAVANYPTLLVEGPVVLKLRQDRPLDERDDGGHNYNPAGTPYQGIADDDTNDTYPSEIRGLVYASGDVTLRNTPQLTGVLMAGGGLIVTGSPTLTYQSTYLDNPPPGFQTTVLTPVAGSWRQLVD